MLILVLVIQQAIIIVIVNSTNYSTELNLDKCEYGNCQIIITHVQQQSAVCHLYRLHVCIRR